MAKDEKFYAAALEEFSSGVVDKDTMAKAFILANGDPELAKYKYLNLKVDRLKKDSALIKSKEIINKASFGVSSFIESRISERENHENTLRLTGKKEEKKEKEEKKKLEKFEKMTISQESREKDDKAVEIFFAIVIIAVIVFFILSDQY